MSISKIRKEIDQLDNQILDLINVRLTKVKTIGELKLKEKAPIYRPEREKEILDRLALLNKGPLNERGIEAIFLEIFAVSRNLELPEKVSYLGPTGSFSHQAAEMRFGAMNEYVGLPSIRSVFENVDTGRARFGVIPIENNQQGVVSETVFLLEEFDLKIVAEVPMDIHFAFASNSERINDIKRIYSRDIAFRQCRSFIQEYFREEEIELIPVDSTSKAVQISKDENNSAAICSHVAAQDGKLPILFENIEDSSHNQTRFLIISRDFINQKGEINKTSVWAKLPDEPGSLAGYLQRFHKAGINLTKIESYPAKRGKSFKYWFFIEFEGHFEDAVVKKIMTQKNGEVKWLGSYVKLC